MAINPADHPFSRRAFLAGAGAITTAFVSPLVPGQRVPDATSPLNVLAPREAYAATSAYNFLVKTNYDLACSVVDVSDEDDSGKTNLDKGENSGLKPFVKDASITITSLNGDKVSNTKKSDEFGTAVFDIRDYMEGYDPKTTFFKKGYGPENGTYACYASVSVRSTDCRQIDIKKAWLMGGEFGGLGLPACRLTDATRNRPYFRSVSFNGYDVQYTTATFTYSRGNDATQKIAAELYLKDSGDATISFWRWRAKDEKPIFPGIQDSDAINEQNGFTKLGFFNVGISESKANELRALDAKDEQAMASKSEYSQKAYDDRWIRSVSLEDRFLQTTFKRGFNEGDRLIVCVETKGQKWPYLMAAKFRKAPLAEVESGTYDSMPGFGSQDLGIKLPSSWPKIGGTKISASFMPQIPVIYDVNPLGYLMIGLSIGIAGETENKKSPFDKKNWETVKLEDAEKQRKEHNDKMNKLWDDYKQARKDRKDAKAAGKQVDKFTKEFFSGFELSAAAQISANLSYGITDGSMKGGLWFMAMLSGEGKFGWNMMFCGAPFYVTFAPSASLTFAAGVGIQSMWPSGDADFTDKIVQFFKEITLDWQGSQVGITLNVGMDIAVGAGIQGAVSLGGRGSAAITCYLGLWDSSGYDAADGYTFPHVRVGAGIDTYICGQFFMCKVSYPLWSWSWPALYDNWESQGEAAGIGGDEEPEYTKTEMPKEFRLNNAHAASIGGDPDEGCITDGTPGAFAITLEMLAEQGQSVTDAELATSSEFATGSSARTASIGSDEDEATLTANYIPADDPNNASNVDTYQLVLVYPEDENDAQVAEDEAAQANDSGNVAAAAAATNGAVATAAGNDAAADDADGAEAGSEAATGQENTKQEDQQQGASTESSQDGTATAVAADDAAATTADNGDEIGSTQAAGSDDTQTAAATAVAGTAALSADDNAEAEAAVEANTQATDADSSDDEYIEPEITCDDQGEELNFNEQGTVEEVESSHFTNGDSKITASIAGVSSEGALSPSADYKLLTGVYSDGRVRIVTLGNTRVMLRIASCSIGDEHRTRLVYQVCRGGSNWTNPRTISFELEGLRDIKRADLYDYDFDVCQIDSGAVAIVLLSGRRANGDDTTLLQACTDPVTSVIVLSPIYRQPIVSMARSWRSFDKGSELESDGKAYLTYAPCISRAWGSSSSTTTHPCYIAGSFVYKRATSDKILKEETPAQVAGFCLYALCNIQRNSWGDQYRWALASATTFRMDGAPASVYNLSASSYTYRGRIFFHMGYESAEGCGIFEARFSYNYDNGNRKGSIGVTVYPPDHYRSIKKLYAKGYWSFLGIDANEVLCELRGEPQDGNFATVSAYSTQTSNDTIELTTTIVPTIPASFTFSADKNFIVWAENAEGINGFNYDGVAQDDEPKATYEEGRYHIMASRAVTCDGITLYTRPFVLCEVDYPIDSIASATSDTSALHLVVSSITSLQNSQCDYHEIVLPLTALATPVSMTTPFSLLSPGQTSTMEITLRNDGNTQLSGVTLAIQDVQEDGSKTTVAEKEIPFNADTVLNCPGAKANPDDPAADWVFDSGFHNTFSTSKGIATQSGGTPFDTDKFVKHTLVAGEGRNYLTPGGQTTVSFDLDVPGTWEGEKKLSVAVTGLKFVNPANGAIVESKGSGVTARTAEDENGSIACITAAIGSDVIDAANEPFADFISVNIPMGGTVAEDSLGLSDLHASRLLQPGDVVVPDDDSDDDSGNGSGSGSGSAGSGSGSGSNGGSNSNASGSSNGNGSSKDTLPALGDHAAGLGAAGAIAALAGAGLMAYSRRRTQIEAEAEAAANASAAPNEDR